MASKLTPDDLPVGTDIIYYYGGLPTTWTILDAYSRGNSIQIGHTKYRWRWVDVSELELVTKDTEDLLR